MSDQQPNPVVVPIREHEALKLQHLAELEAKDTQWQVAIDQMGERYREGIERETKAHAELTAQLQEKIGLLSGEIELLKQTHAAELAAVRDKAEFQVSQYALAHREALGILSESPEARALRAHHAREAAEIAARQEADRKALSAKLSQ